MLDNKVDEFYEDILRLRTFEKELSEQQVNDSTRLILNDAVKYEAESMAQKYSGLGSPEKEMLEVMLKYYAKRKSPSQNIRKKESENEKITKEYKKDLTLDQIKFITMKVDELPFPEAKKQALYDYFSRIHGPNVLVGDIIQHKIDEFLRIPKLGKIYLSRLESLAKKEGMKIGTKNKLYTKQLHEIYDEQKV